MSLESRSFHQEYLNWGSIRPPQEILTGIVYNDLSFIKNPTATLVAAHACIDMTMCDPDRSDFWIQHAHQAFDRVIDWPDPYKARVSGATTNAHLQKAF